MAVGVRSLGSCHDALPARPRLGSVCRGWIRAAFAAAALLLVPAAAIAEEEGTSRFSVADLINGSSIGEEACKAASGAVWVANVAGGPACIRAYYSDFGGRRPMALAFFSSDFVTLGPNGRPLAPPDYGLLSPAVLQDRAEAWSRRYGGPVVIIGRPGTLGSSGRQLAETGTRREVDIVGAVLDALKERHGLDGFQLAGLVEGGNIAATLGVRRQDVGCVVAGSAPLSRLTLLSLYQQNLDPSLINRLNDPLQVLARTRPRKGLRFIAFINDGDLPGTEESVVAYLNVAREAGLSPLPLKLPSGDVEARGRIAVEAAIRCGSGDTDRAIVTALAEQVSNVSPREPAPRDQSPRDQTSRDPFAPADPPSAATLPPQSLLNSLARPQAVAPQTALPSLGIEPASPPAPTQAPSLPKVAPSEATRPLPLPQRELAPPAQPAAPQVQAKLSPPERSLPPAPKPAGSPEKFSRAEVLAGRTADEATCLATPFTVWVTSAGSPECIRYYYSATGGQGARALLFMNGDFTYLGPDGQPTVDPSYDEIGPKDMQRIADVRSRDYGGPMVYLARPGTLGSSGNELKLRHTPREVALISAAIAEIKRRHLISTFDVVGQSGGGLLLGALVAMRNDIGCAISSSGVLATNDWVSGRLRVKAAHDASLYDPIDHIGEIRPGPDFRFIVLTDAKDERVPPQSTDAYVKALQARGITVRHIAVTSADPAHHDLALHGIRAAIACARGALDPEIATLLTKTVVTQPHMSEMSPLGEMPKTGTLAPSRGPAPEVLRPAQPEAPRPRPLQPSQEVPQPMAAPTMPAPVRPAVPAPRSPGGILPVAPGPDSSSVTRGGAVERIQPGPSEDLPPSRRGAEPIAYRGGRLHQSETPWPAAFTVQSPGAPSAREPNP